MDDKADISFINSYGIVVCGGNSSRMRTDKSLLTYFEKPQRYHVYDMLVPHCEKIFISCNQMQVPDMADGYGFITDQDAYQNIGPMAALLSAFASFPDKNILLIGCDYPFLTSNELRQFSTFCRETPAAFYNEKFNVYEPMLAWYPASCIEFLKEMHKGRDFSLQHFLKENHALKFYPADKKTILSIDTEPEFTKALEMTRR